MSYRNRVFLGSCEHMDDIPSESVHMCITSPPYWGLRDYHVDEQVGMEPTPQEYVDRLVRVFREVKRVLRPDGTLWLNLGDTYASSATGAHGITGGRDKSTLSGDLPPLGIMGHKRTSPSQYGAKPKDLVGIPWLTAFALRDDGWYLRSDIIWHKPNPMPSSVDDRCTSSHEYIFMLSKKKNYFYDADAIREPLKAIAQYADTGSQIGTSGAGGDNRTYSGRRWYPRPAMNRAVQLAEKHGLTDEHLAAIKSIGFAADPGKTHTAQSRGNERYDPHMMELAQEARAKLGAYYREFMSPIMWTPGTQRTQQGCDGQMVHPDGISHDLSNPWLGANKRDVWSINPAGYDGAHFAVFPEELVRTCILAGSSAQGVCENCGAPTVRKIERIVGDQHDNIADPTYKYETGGKGNSRDPSSFFAQALSTYRGTAGWEPSCSCAAGKMVPAVILDPFMGSGTTARVAIELGRNYVGYELSPSYHALIEARLGLFYSGPTTESFISVADIPDIPEPITPRYPPSEDKDSEPGDGVPVDPVQEIPDLRQLDLFGTGLLEPQLAGSK